MDLGSPLYILVNVKKCVVLKVCQPKRLYCWLYNINVATVLYEMLTFDQAGAMGNPQPMAFRSMQEAHSGSLEEPTPYVESHRSQNHFLRHMKPVINKEKGTKLR